MATVAEQMQKMSAKVFSGTGGGGGGNGMSMPTMAAMPAPAAPAVPQYDDSAASQLAKITTSDSPLMKQAASAGLATANRRGLLNSSVAVGASQAETIKAATPIAQADAAVNAQKNLQATANSAAAARSHGFVRCRPASAIAIGVVAALRLWPAHDPDVIPHDHADLPADDPHHAEHAKGDHAFVIDRRHPKWPNR